MPAYIEIPKGTRFNMLTFLERVTIDGKKKCRCRCDCGSETFIDRNKLSRTKSCGCLRRTTGKDAVAYKHGHASKGGKRSPTLSVWSNMIDRCRRKSHSEWHNYGGRGIDVCKKWEEFANFLADMGERPSMSHTLDRINNKKGYHPNNCRWATRKEQMRNTRANDMIAVDGELLCQTDAAAAVGVSRDRVKRLVRRGFKLSSENSAFLQTVHTNGRLIEFNGKTQSVTAWAEELGIKRDALYNRLRRGWSINRALSKH